MEYYRSYLDSKISEVALLCTAAQSDPIGAAKTLFVALAKAQPFEDGNKRTALFVANGQLISTGTQLMLTVPVDDQDPAVAASFNDLLARAYLYDEHEAVKTLLRRAGLTRISR